MILTQLFETTVVDSGSENQARFISVPRRSLAHTDLLPPEDTVDPNLSERTAALLEVLGLRQVTRLREFRLVEVIAMCLAAERSQELTDQLAEGRFLQFDQFSDLADFAQAITFTPVVPFEQSPLDLSSVTTILGKASGIGLGAYVGLVVGAGTPLIFLTVPTGMLLCGAAAGVAKALHDGLYERLVRIIRGTSTEEVVQKRRIHDKRALSANARAQAVQRDIS
jgi:hypothetical protein